jgi:hypothetical protein
MTFRPYWAIEIGLYAACAEKFAPTAIGSAGVAAQMIGMSGERGRDLEGIFPNDAKEVENQGASYGR